jgi:phage-related protein
MVINLVNNVANMIRSSSGAMNAAGYNLASAVIQGMVSGILGGLSGVVSAIGSMASSAINAAKRFLHINSPSRDFAEIGDSIPEGAAFGVNRSGGMLTGAVQDLAGNALDTMKNSLSGISDVINSNINLQPTITPVIDLTLAQKGFSDLSNMSKAQLISASASSTKASSISAGTTAASASTASSGTTKSLTFIQNNTSPKALSAADIYRQTKNQLSVVKGALP